MDAGFLAALFLGALAGGFVNGLAGFGTALFALGFWLHILPAPQAVAIAVVMSVASGLQGVWIVRRDIRRNPGRLGRFLIPALAGIPLGLAFLSIVSAEMLRIGLAGFMLLYGGFFLIRRSLPQFDRHTPVADMAIGLAGGILGGAASLSGALPSMWCTLRPWSKGETRAVLQPYNVIVLTVAAIALAWNGFYTGQTLALVGLSLPATMIGAQAGVAVFRRLSDDQFRFVLIVLMFLSGLILALRELS